MACPDSQKDPASNSKESSAAEAIPMPDSISEECKLKFCKDFNGAWQADKETCYATPENICKAMKGVWENSRCTYKHKLMTNAEQVEQANEQKIVEDINSLPLDKRCQGEFCLATNGQFKVDSKGNFVCNMNISQVPSNKTYKAENSENNEDISIKEQKTQLREFELDVSYDKNLAPPYQNIIAIFEFEFQKSKEDCQGDFDQETEKCWIKHQPKEFRFNSPNDISIKLQIDDSLSEYRLTLRFMPTNPPSKCDDQPIPYVSQTGVIGQESKIEINLDLKNIKTSPIINDDKEIPGVCATNQ